MLDEEKLLIDEEDIIFTEEDSIPLEFYEYIPDKILYDALYRKVYYLSAQLNNQYCGIAIFFLAEDFSGAVLSHIYVRNGYRNKGVGKILMNEARSRLADIGCMNMICMAYGDDVEVMNRFLTSCGMKAESNEALRLSYEYENIMHVETIQHKSEPEVEYITDADHLTENSLTTANILRSLGIPFMCHEGIKGAGRFMITYQDELIGVMLGEYAPSGDLYITKYIDDREADNPETFLTLLYEMVEDFISKATFDKQIHILCNSSLQRDIAESLLGPETHIEKAVVLSFP